MTYYRRKNDDYQYGRLRTDQQTIWPIRISSEYELVKPIRVTLAVFGPNAAHMIYYGDKTSGFRDSPLTGRGKNDVLATRNLLQKMEAYLLVLKSRGHDPALSGLELSRRQELSDMLSPIKQMQN